MNDAEAVECSALDAETALIALGFELIWNTHHTGAILGYKPGQLLYNYMVRPEPIGTYTAFYWKQPDSKLQGRDQLPDEICAQTELKAKSACEVHAATGQFPHSVAVEVSRPKGLKH